MNSRHCNLWTISAVPHISSRKQTKKTSKHSNKYYQERCMLRDDGRQILSHSSPKLNYCIVIRTDNCMYSKTPKFLNTIILNLNESFSGSVCWDCSAWQYRESKVHTLCSEARLQCRCVIQQMHCMYISNSVHR